MKNILDLLKEESKKRRKEYKILILAMYTLVWHKVMCHVSFQWKSNSLKQ